MKIFKTFFILINSITLLLIAQSSFGTTSCGPEFTFIGLSKAGETAYFEGQYSGECTPLLILYSYNPGNYPKVDIAAKLDLTEFDTENVWVMPKIQGKELLSKDRAVREAAKRRFWKSNYFPNILWGKQMIKSFVMKDENGRSEKVSFTSGEFDHKLWFMDKVIRKPATVLKSKDRECFFPSSSALYTEEEEYLYGIGDIVRAYYLPENEAWIIISEHPNIGDSGNVADAVRIYNMYKCKDI